MTRIARIARIGLLVAVFATGYLAGTLNQPSAEAQLDDALKAAGTAAAGDAVGDTGSLAEVAKLGTTITEMQGSIESLQGSLKVLSSIQSALGG